MVNIKCSFCQITVCSTSCINRHDRRFHCHNIDCSLYREPTCVIDGMLCPASYATQGSAPPPPPRSRSHREEYYNNDRQRRGRNPSRRQLTRDPIGESFRHVYSDEDRLQSRFERSRSQTRRPAGDVPPPHIPYRHVGVSTSGYSEVDPKIDSLRGQFERTSVRDDAGERYRYEEYADHYDYPPSPPPQQRNYRGGERYFQNPRPRDPEPQYVYECTEDPEGNVIDEAPPLPPSPPPAADYY